ncbi:hypothetical protein Scep_010357 [Stephania cephalantha]|uniref:Uncharacterized protein n=1 Tax=Stephania cephalantha TaxID=152367 RepID=A0AAP0JUW1_9MAGN
MDGNLLAIADANREMCTQGTALVTGISSPNELDPSDVFFNPLLFFLFLLFSFNTCVASTEISTGTTIENISGGIGSAGMTGETKCALTILEARSTDAPG